MHKQNLYNALVASLSGSLLPHRQSAYLALSQNHYIISHYEKTLCVETLIFSNYMTIVVDILCDKYYCIDNLTAAKLKLILKNKY